MTGAPSHFEASAFLTKLPHTVVNLVAIDPEVGAPVGITRPKDHPALADFIQKHTGTRNLYFAVNEPKPGAPDKKLGKRDIALIHGVCADLDAKGENIAESQSARAQRDSQVAELRKHALSAPTILVDSGGGYGAFWLFPEPLTATPENIKLVEAQGLGLAFALDGDRVQNVDRIMRLPGTINLPDARKRARGRVAVPAAVVYADGPRRCLADLAKFAAPQESAVKAENPDGVPIDIGMMREANTFLELPIALRQKIQNLELDNPHLEAMLAGNFNSVPMLRDSSRSGQLFALAGFFRAGGFTATEFAQAAWVWPHAYYAAWHQADDAAVRRDLQRAWAACADGLSVYTARPNAEDENWGPVPAELGDQTPKASRFRLEEFDAIKPDLKRRDLIKGLVLRLGTLGIIGAPGSGKSQVEADMGVSIAAGLPWCGHRVMQGAVICALGEGVEGFRGRVQAIRETKGLTRIPFFIVPLAPNLMDKADVVAFVAICREAVSRCGSPLRIAFIDTLTTATPGMDQNSTEGMSRVVSALRYISRELDCVSAAIHHTGKDKAKGARGSSVFNGDLDTELMVEATGPKTFSVSQSKQRDFEKGRPFKFEQRSAVIGQDADGDNVTAVYAEYEISAPDDDFGPVGAPLKKQQQCLFDVLEAAGSWLPRAEFRDRFVTAWTPLSEGAERKSIVANFRNIARELLALGRIERRGEGPAEEFRIGAPS